MSLSVFWYYQPYETGLPVQYPFELWKSSFSKSTIFQLKAHLLRQTPEEDL